VTTTDPLPQIHLEHAELLERATGRGPAELETLGREALLVRLYALGVLTSGEGAHFHGISRREFLDLLDAYHVSIFDEAVDLQHEAELG